MKMMESSPLKERKHCGEGEISCYDQFILFPHCFQKDCTRKNKDLFGKGLSPLLQELGQFQTKCRFSIHVL